MTKDLLKLFQQVAPVIATHHPEIIHMIKKISPSILSQPEKSSTSAITASLPKHVLSATAHASPAIKPPTVPPLISANEIRSLNKFNKMPLRHFSNQASSNNNKDKTGLFFEVRTGGDSGPIYKASEKVEITSKGANFKLYEDDNFVIGTNGVDFKFSSCKIS